MAVHLYIKKNNSLFVAVEKLAFYPTLNYMTRQVRM
jgi:hypothetical protein